MTNRESLIRAAALNPGEDVPILMLADWLEENNQADYAAFVRCMCKHARNEHSRHRHVGRYVSRHGIPRLTPFLARAWRLWLWDDLPISTHRFRVKDRARVLSAGWERAWEHAGQWEWELPRRAIVRRGFVEEVHCYCGDLTVFAEGWFNEQPITRVTLCDRRPCSDSQDQTWGWFKRDAGGRFSGEEAELPPEMWDELPVGYTERDKQAGAGWWRSYHSRDAAENAVSVACVAYGRKRAGFLIEEEVKS